MRAVVAAFTWILWFDESIYLRGDLSTLARPKFKMTDAYDTKVECERRIADHAKEMPSVILSADVKGGKLYPTGSGDYVARRYECWPAGADPMKR